MRADSKITASLVLIAALLGLLSLSGCQMLKAKRHRQSATPKWKVARTIAWGNKGGMINSRGNHQYALDPGGSYLWVLDRSNVKIMHLGLYGEADKEVQLEGIDSLKRVGFLHVAMDGIAAENRGRLRFSLVDPERADTDQRPGGAGAPHRVIDFDEDTNITGSFNYEVPSNTAPRVYKIASGSRDNLYVFSIDDEGTGEAQALTCISWEGKQRWTIDNTATGKPLSYAYSPMIFNNGRLYVQGMAERLSGVVALKTVEDGGKSMPVKDYNGYDLLGVDYKNNVYVSNYDVPQTDEDPVSASVVCYSPQGEVLETILLPATVLPGNISRTVLVSDAGDIYQLEETEQDGVKIWTLE